MSGTTGASPFRRNAATAYAARGIVALSALLLTPYLYRRLGPGGFGTWSVAFTLGTVFSLLEFGFSAGVVKYTAEFRAQGRRAELRAAAGAAVALMGLLAVVAALFAVAAGFLLDGLAAQSERDDFRTGMLVLAAATLVRFPGMAYAAVLNGYQRYDLTNGVLGLTTVGFVVGAIAAAEYGAGVVGVMSAYAVSLAAGGILYAALLAFVDRGLLVPPLVRDWPAVRRVLSFSSFALLADSMVFVGQRLDIVVIAAIRNAATAAPYAAAVKLQSGLQSLTLPFVDLLMPMASDLWARGERADVVRRLTLAVRVSAQVTLPVAAGIALFAEDIADVWLGESAGQAAAIIVLLMAAQALTLSAFPAEKVLVGIGRVRAISALSLVEGLSNISLSIFLIVRYGAVGAALGTLLTSAVLSPLRFPLAARATGSSTVALLRGGLVPAVVAALPAVAAMLAVRATLPGGPARLALGVGLGLVVAVAAAVTQIGPRRSLAALRQAGARVRRDPELVSELRAEAAP